jgi:hypothetical protein
MESVGNVSWNRHQEIIIAFIDTMLSSEKIAVTNISSVSHIIRS